MSESLYWNFLLRFHKSIHTKSIRNASCV